MNVKAQRYLYVIDNCVYILYYLGFFFFPGEALRRLFFGKSFIPTSGQIERERERERERLTAKERKGERESKGEREGERPIPK